MHNIPTPKLRLILRFIGDNSHWFLLLAAFLLAAPALFA